MSAAVEVQRQLAELQAGAEKAKEARRKTKIAETVSSHDSPGAKRMVGCQILLICSASDLFYRFVLFSFAT